MLSRLVACTLFVGFIVTETQAATDAELEALAEMFSPILILTKEIGDKWGDIKVIKPEPVEIVGAQNLAEPSAELGSKSLLVAVNSPLAASDDSLPAQTETGRRIAKKAIAGSLSSAIFSYVLVDVQESGANLGGLGSLGGVLYGHLLGFPIGVSSVDPYDSFFGTMMGCILGGVGGVGFLYFFAATGSEVNADLLAFTLLGGPAVGSLIASETWRKPPQNRRISFSLTPNPKGGLSAFATLRF